MRAILEDEKKQTPVMMNSLMLRHINGEACPFFKYPQ
jgi:hypothetical protein